MEDIKCSPVTRHRRELAYEGTILKVYKDYVSANSHEVVWDFIHHDGAAAVLPISDEGKIIMVRQYRNALDRYTLEIPAGKVDSIDEPRVICACRELREETGMKVSSPDDLEFLIRINTAVAFCNEEIDIFIARKLEKSTQELDDDEDIVVAAYDLEELLAMIQSGELCDAKTVAAICAYATMV